MLIFLVTLVTGCLLNSFALAIDDCSSFPYLSSCSRHDQCYGCSGCCGYVTGGTSYPICIRCWGETSPGFEGALTYCCPNTPTPTPTPCSACTFSSGTSYPIGYKKCSAPPPENYIECGPECIVLNESCPPGTVCKSGTKAGEINCEPIPTPTPIPATCVTEVGTYTEGQSFCWPAVGNTYDFLCTCDSDGTIDSDDCIVCPAGCETVGDPPVAKCKPSGTPEQTLVPNPSP